MTSYLIYYLVQKRKKKEKKLFFCLIKKFKYKTKKTFKIENDNFFNDNYDSNNTNASTSKNHLKTPKVLLQNRKRIFFIMD